MLLTPLQVARVAYNAGFRGENLVLAVAVAGAESDFYTNAFNRNNDGSTDMGLWQINSVHKFSPIVLSTADGNARAAYTVWRNAGNSWRPWTAYRHNRHLPYMPTARQAATLLGQNPPAPNPIPNPPIPTPAPKPAPIPVESDNGEGIEAAIQDLADAATLDPTPQPDIAIDLPVGSVTIPYSGYVKVVARNAKALLINLIIVLLGMLMIIYSLKGYATRVVLRRAMG